MMNSDRIRKLLKQSINRGENMNDTCDICGRTISELRQLNPEYAEINENDSGLKKCGKCSREEKAGLESDDQSMNSPDQAVQGWKQGQSYY